MLSKDEFNFLMYEFEKSNSKIEDLDVSQIPRGKGVFLVCKPKEMDIIFSDTLSGELTKQDIIPPYLLQDYHDKSQLDILCIGVASTNLYRELRAFIAFGGHKQEGFSNKKSEFCKLIWQIENNCKLDIRFISSDDGKDPAKLKEELLEYCILNLGNKPIGNTRHKSNDAIASWSGFNYQGMTMILRVLSLINQNIITQVDSSTYQVELEKHEDFVILDGQSPTEIYQVKAKLASKNYSGYKDAVLKLLDHRKQLGNPSAKCILISAAKISDWNDCAEKGVIELYKYSGECNICVTKVTGYIKDEIWNYYRLKQNKFTDAEVDLGFHYLCQEVDKLISQLHGGFTTNYIIKFSRIIEILNVNIEKSMISHMTRTRLTVQEFIYREFYNTITDFCNNCEMKNCMNCNIFEISSMFNDLDLIEYAHIIDPTKLGNDYYFNLVQTFESDKLYWLFEQIKLSDTNLLGYDEKHIFLRNLQGNEYYMDKIIPSNISFVPTKENITGISKTLEAIEKKKDSVRNAINKSALTADMRRDVINYREERIYYDDTTQDNNAKYSIMPNFDFNIVNRMKFIDSYGGEQYE